MSNVYVHKMLVSTSDIDGNGHANNVAFVRWMQEAAIAHADAAGCTQATQDVSATWVVRSHRIDYARPAFAGDQIEVKTWVANFRRAFSLRKYEFVRPSDNTTLATGETDWIFVDIANGRPKSIPPEMVAMFGVG